MGSTRLPMKMMKLLCGKPLIWHVIHRVKQAKLVDRVMLATSEDKDNIVLVNEAKKYGIDTFIGNEEDVLDRYYQCAKEFMAEAIVRITGDCPLIDPKLIDEVISLFNKNSVDYASNIHPPTYPDGMDVEVFSLHALERAWREAQVKSEREHVTPYIWKNKELFKCVNLKNDEDLSGLRLTVDEKEDLIFLNKLLEKIDSNEYYLEEIVKIINEGHDLREIKSKFSRNEGYKESLREDKE